eukprot:CAMPEP_0178399044 /NCGR_PEP_ID=MMETSP0689_2-20121128/15079_1 /TAXON_ID=160604 /ORGANISM="Amphidinium massartii, Strain CS-259" /LENGTH=588 /DNA_ID=CAMNT_0020019813 /DNA_START=68 /DNA_END=1834 /DNA_ORIENTATION=-
MQAAILVAAAIWNVLGAESTAVPASTGLWKVGLHNGSPGGCGSQLAANSSTFPDQCVHAYPGSRQWYKVAGCNQDGTGTPHLTIYNDPQCSTPADAQSQPSRAPADPQDCVMTTFYGYTSECLVYITTTTTSTLGPGLFNVSHYLLGCHPGDLLARAVSIRPNECARMGMNTYVKVWGCLADGSGKPNALLYQDAFCTIAHYAGFQPPAPSNPQDCTKPIHTNAGYLIQCLPYTTTTTTYASPPGFFTLDFFTDSQCQVPADATLVVPNSFQGRTGECLHATMWAMSDVYIMVTGCNPDGSGTPVLEAYAGAGCKGATIPSVALDPTGACVDHHGGLKGKCYTPSTAAPHLAPKAHPTAAPLAPVPGLRGPTAGSTAVPPKTPSTVAPNASPLPTPKMVPTVAPTAAPTAVPGVKGSTAAPTAVPQGTPTAGPTAAPTSKPTAQPALAATLPPTQAPDPSNANSGQAWMFNRYAYLRKLAAFKAAKAMTPQDLAVANAAVQALGSASSTSTTTTTTTTSEMPWGLPWWAWFLICCGILLLCALCCLPALAAPAAMGGGKKKSQGESNPSYVTVEYEVVDEPDAPAGVY